MDQPVLREMTPGGEYDPRMVFTHTRATMAHSGEWNSLSRQRLGPDELRDVTQWSRAELIAWLRDDGRILEGAGTPLERWDRDELIHTVLELKAS